MVRDSLDAVVTGSGVTLNADHVESLRMAISQSYVAKPANGSVEFRMDFASERRQARFCLDTRNRGAGFRLQASARQYLARECAGRHDRRLIFPDS